MNTTNGHKTYRMKVGLQASGSEGKVTRFHLQKNS